MSTSRYTVRYLPQFVTFLKGLKDPLVRQRLVKRIKKAELGNLGDVKSVGNKVFEMREDFGPGWRMYYFYSGRELIIMLAGGDKSTQDRDIKHAHNLALDIENDDEQ